MLAHFERGSSDIDWCESNYAHSAFIAEYFNTISNVIFFIVPPFLMYLFRNYSRHIGPGINIIWILLVVIGASSAYFHATLSLVGQLLDELAIMWVLMAAFALWAPKWLLERYFNGNRDTLTQFVIGSACVTTILGFLYPVANAFVLICFGIPFVVLLIMELKKCNNSRVIKLGYITCMWWLLAVAMWLNDRLFCDVWQAVSFPYLHCGWHILIFIASYLGCVLGAYFYTVSEHIDKKPELAFWPKHCEWGIPYVDFKLPMNHP